MLLGDMSASCAYVNMLLKTVYCPSVERPGKELMLITHTEDAVND